MFEQLRAEWQEFRRAQGGERFVRYHQRYQGREAPLLKAMLFFATVFCVGMSVVLPVASESTWPALLFAAISLVLLPGESRLVALAFDKIEALVTSRRAERGPAAVVQAPSIDAPVKLVEQRAPRTPVSRPTVRMPVPPLGNDAPSVLATPPVIVNNMRTTPCVRAQVVAPRIAGTLKIWGASDQPTQPSAAPKLTLVLFPPPAGEDQAIRSRGS